MIDKYDFKVSAVIPAYNAENYIRETVDSLTNQTQPLCEIIVIDDKSKDRTAAIVDEMKEGSKVPIKLINNNNNLGVSSSRNIGMSVAQGDWILFMDADDAAEPSLLEYECRRLKELQDKSPDNWVLVYPAYRQIDKNGKFLSHVMRGKQVDANEIFGYEIVRNQIITPSGLMLNKDIAIQEGGFKLGLEYQIEDWELWLRLARIGGFAYIDEPLVRVRRHSSNATKCMNKALLAEQEVLKNYGIGVIRAGIYKRKLPQIKNLTDYVSVLFKLDYWDLGYKELSIINSDGINDSIMFLKGLYYIKNVLLDSAQESFENAIDLNPENGAAMNNLGVLYALSGKIDEAKFKFNKAIELYPGYIDALSNLRYLESEERLTQENCRYTWRELRPVLLHYSE